MNQSPAPDAPGPGLQAKMKQPSTFIAGGELARLCAVWNPSIRTETLPVGDALGRVTAVDVFSQTTMPVVRGAKADGIAVDAARFADGTPDTAAWQPGRDYALVTTGEDFDDSFNAVIYLEDIEFLPGGGIRIAPGVPVWQGRNVHPSGSQVRRGQCLVPAHSRLRPLDLARMASGGIGAVEVLCGPVVAVIPTGNELVTSSAQLVRGKYIETNSLFLRESLKELGAVSKIFPIVRDERQALNHALDQALASADIVIITGGTARGQRDFNAQIMLERGTMHCLGKTAQGAQPARVVLMDGKPVINLPGPPEALYHGFSWCVRGVVAYFLHQPFAEHVPAHTPVVAESPAERERFSLLLRLEVERGEDGTLEARSLEVEDPADLANAPDGLSIGDTPTNGKGGLKQ